MKLLAEHFQPKRLMVVERYKFLKTHQKPGQSLQEYFSEYALIKYRVTVEIEYLMLLADKKFLKLSASAKKHLRALKENFSVENAEAIKEIDVKDSITFKASGKQLHEVYVFTDTDCGYCRKFHEEIKDYTSKGITVHYFPWPRSGTQGPTYDTMVSVWCAKDPAKALTDAKQGKAVAKATCDNPVSKYVEIGRKMGVNGTPAIYNLQANQLGGYVPPADLLKALDATKAP